MSRHYVHISVINNKELYFTMGYPLLAFFFISACMFFKPFHLTAITLMARFQTADG